MSVSASGSADDTPMLTSGELQALWTQWSTPSRINYLKILEASKTTKDPNRTELSDASLAAHWVEKLKVLYQDEDPDDVLGQGLCCTDGEAE